MNDELEYSLGLIYHLQLVGLSEELRRIKYSDDGNLTRKIIAVERIWVLAN